jgi:hypothetical protein
VGVTEIPAAAELARLRAENARLLKMLELSSRRAATPGPAQVGFFDAPPGPVHKDSPNDAKVAFFRALFAARTDIYATRIENSRTGWKGWLPAVRGGWQRGSRMRSGITSSVISSYRSVTYRDDEGLQSGCSTSLSSTERLISRVAEPLPWAHQRGGLKRVSKPS